MHFKSAEGCQPEVSNSCTKRPNMHCLSKTQHKLKKKRETYLFLMKYENKIPYFLVGRVTSKDICNAKGVNCKRNIHRHRKRFKRWGLIALITRVSQRIKISSARLERTNEPRGTWGEARTTSNGNIWACALASRGFAAHKMAPAPMFSDRAELDWYKETGRSLVN